MLCCKGSLRQVILPLSSYDSSLDFLYTFSPFSLSLLVFLICLCFTSLCISPTLPCPSFHPNPQRCELNYGLSFTLFFDSNFLSYTALIRSMPNEANHHTDRQISLIRDPKANTREVGKYITIKKKNKTEMLLINS